MRKIFSLLFALLVLTWTASEAALPLEKLHLPPGFHASVYAQDVASARSLALGADGTVYVGSNTAGKVYALRDHGHDQPAEVITLAEGLRGPNGVTLYRGALYVGETHRVIRFPDIQHQLHANAKYEVVYDKLPATQSHGRRFIRFGPDDKLYIGIGVPCNTCEPENDKYGTILRMNADGSGAEVYARGIRNTVGFDWNPQTGKLWFTDNGRDWLGDDSPPDELNTASQPGMHFGYPYCHAGDIADPEFGSKMPCSHFTPPAAKLGPHVAALGMRFYTSDKFPPHYRNGIFIAEHGSWNRSDPIGYRVMFVPIEGGKATGYEVFAKGWLQRGSPWGRPVDVLVMPDGALLVSDDYSGTVYRISYERGK